MPTDDTASSGSIRLASLFLTLPTRALTSQQVIPSDGYGARRALSWPGSVGSSPSQTGQVSGPKTTGIRSWSSAQSSFAAVVTIAKLRTHSPAGERQFSHKPANAILSGGARIVEKLSRIVTGYVVAATGAAA